MNKIKLLKGAAPFFYPGNEIGCLVLHGFTGMPQEVRWLGEHLNEQGYTVHGPRLAGHGSTIQDMTHTHWREWYLTALAGYEMLRDRCTRVFVLGLSMGGALSLMLAAQEDVGGVVAMATPYDLHDSRRPFIPILRLFIQSIDKERIPPEEDPFQQRVIAEQKRRGEEPIGHISYPAWPVRQAGYLADLLAEMRARLPDITAPVLLMHSRTDDTVPFNDLQLIYEAIGSPDKQMLVLGESLHVITEDVERETVFKAASDFIAAHL